MDMVIIQIDVTFIWASRQLECVLLSMVFDELNLSDIDFVIVE